MTTTAGELHSLYQARRGAVEFVDVPLLGYLMVDGTGDPAAEPFRDAVQALFTVSYGIHFRLKRENRDVPKVQPLEALWWLDGPRQELFDTADADPGSIVDIDRSRWRWRAMMAQPEQVSTAIAARAVADAQAKRELPALPLLRFEHWAEGRCAQLLHVGPYADEPATVRHLHAGIAAAGYRPHGRHHEIYLSDPHRTNPQRLRTIIRHPVEPLPG